MKKLTMKRQWTHPPPPPPVGLGTALSGRPGNKFQLFTQNQYNNFSYLKIIFLNKYMQE